MLNTLSASPYRRRGAQLRNNNARKHGFYAARHPHPFASIFSSHRHENSSHPQSESSIHESILVLSQLAACSFDTWQAHRDDQNAVPFPAILTRALLEISALSKQRFKLLLPAAHLRDLIQNAHYHLNSPFEEIFILPVPVFVPLQFANLYPNSFGPASLSVALEENSPVKFPHQSPWLTDDQWQLISSLFSSLHQELDSTRKYRRHKPAPSDRFLLNGILWKLATGFTWRDLDTLAVASGGEPCARACQQLYHHLYWSGCLRTIYDQLYNHLQCSGQTTLEALVDEGCFVLRGSRIILTPGQELTWQKFTALLLLQRMEHNDRRIQRRFDLARRGQAHFHRIPNSSAPRHRGFSRPHSLCDLHPTLLIFSGCQSLGESGLVPDPNVCEPRFITIEESLGWGKWERSGARFGSVPRVFLLRPPPS